MDPVELAGKTEEAVCDGDRRKYYRFRPAQFYGGIATADCVGCNLRCRFCWAWDVVNNPKGEFVFYSGEEVAKELKEIARKNGFSQVRVSGNEPTIGRPHLLSVLENIPKNLTFILETNGILIGADESYARELSKFPNLHVRVCLKGSTSKEFELFTGANEKFYDYQFRAMENLDRNGVRFHPAVSPVDILTERNLEFLRERLGEIRPDLPGHLEFEYLMKYPAVMERMKKAGLVL